MRPSRSAALLLVVTALIYAPTLSYGYVFEDLNDPTRFFQPVQSLSVMLTEARYYPFRALTALSYDLSKVIGSPVEPWGYHAVNVALHLLNSFLIYRLAARVLSPWAAVGALAIFALHPLQVEAVAYISSRPDLVVTLCILSALLAVEAQRWVLAALACGLALLSKETGVVAVPLVGAWLLWRGAQWPSWRVLGASSAVGLGMVALLASKYALSLDLTYAGGELIKAYAFLLRIPVPIWFSIDHHWVISPALALAGLALAVVLALGALSRPRALWSLATVWVLICLSPRLALPLVEGLHEHHLYAPMLGMSLLVGHLVTLGEPDGISQTFA